MPRSFSSSLLVLLVMLAPLSAAEPVDDTALLEAFEAGVAVAMEEGRGLTAPDLRSELRKQKRSSPHLPKREIPATNDDISTLYERAREATLLLGHLYLCADCDKLHGSISSGVIISPDGLALTNYHVLDSNRARAFGAMTNSGSIHGIAEVVASDKKNDIALIRLEGADGLPALALGLEPPAVGVGVAVVSHPDSHFYTLSTGIVSRYFVTPKTKALRLQITAPFARGSSGSPVVDDSGRIVGLVAATNSIYYTQEKRRQEDFQMTVNSCVPLATILDFLGEQP